MKAFAIATLCIAVAGCQADRPTTGAAPTLADRADLSSADSAQLCLQTARAFEQQGYEREAIVQYERARSFDGPRAARVATRRLAVLYGRTGDVTRANVEYDSALRSSPNDALLWNDAGYFRLTQGDAAGAEQRCRKAVAIDPHYARAWVNLGLALAAEQRFDDSYAAFVTVLSPAQARTNVGIAQAQQGRFGLAEASLHAALDDDAAEPQAQVALRWVEDQLHPTTQPTNSGGT